MPTGSNQADYFNVGYGIASAGFATNTSKAISTTAAAYHGFAIVAGATTPGTLTIYDSIGGAANIIDIVSTGSGLSARTEKYIPIQARLGIYIVATGTGISGTVFYSPKG